MCRVCWEIPGPTPVLDILTLCGDRVCPCTCPVVTGFTDQSKPLSHYTPMQSQKAARNSFCIVITCPCVFKIPEWLEYCLTLGATLGIYTDKVSCNLKKIPKDLQSSEITKQNICLFVV